MATIKMFTPWKWNVVVDNKLTTAFCTLEAAREYCRRNGIDYVVDCKVRRSLWNNSL